MSVMEKLQQPNHHYSLALSYHLLRVFTITVITYTPKKSLFVTILSLHPLSSSSSLQMPSIPPIMPTTLHVTPQPQPYHISMQNTVINLYTHARYLSCHPPSPPLHSCTPQKSRDKKTFTPTHPTGASAISETWGEWAGRGGGEVLFWLTGSRTGHCQ